MSWRLNPRNENPLKEATDPPESWSVMTGSLVLAPELGRSRPACTRRAGPRLYWTGDRKRIDFGFRIVGCRCDRGYLEKIKDSEQRRRIYRASHDELNDPKSVEQLLKKMLA
jgi:hypothetical protein